MKTGRLEIVLLLILSLLPLAPCGSANYWTYAFMSNKEPVGFVILFLLTTSATMWLSEKLFPTGTSLCFSFPHLSSRLATVENNGSSAKIKTAIFWVLTISPHISLTNWEFILSNCPRGVSFQYQTMFSWCTSLLFLHVKTRTKFKHRLCIDFL